MANLNKTVDGKLIELTDEEQAEYDAEQKAVADNAPIRNLFLLRKKRNLLLAETDWSRGDDVPDSLRNKYTEYRQKLRDITKTYNNIEDVTWPTKPS